MRTALRLFLAAIAITGFSLAIGASPALACACNKKQEQAPQSAPAKESAPKYFEQKQAAGTKATCPVMGDTFTISKDSPFSEYKGKFVYFCCPGCKPKFDQEPAKYLPDLK